MYVVWGMVRMLAFEIISFSSTTVGAEEVNYFPVLHDRCNIFFPDGTCICPLQEECLWCTKPHYVSKPTLYIGWINCGSDDDTKFSIFTLILHVPSYFEAQIFIESSGCWVRKETYVYHIKLIVPSVCVEQYKVQYFIHVPYIYKGWSDLTKALWTVRIMADERSRWNDFFWFNSG